MLPKVFFSYTCEDRAIVRDVERCFMETFHIVGCCKDNCEKYPDPKNKQEISESEYVFVFLSRDSVRNSNVMKEIYQALITEVKRDTLVLIPIRIDNCRIPSVIEDRKIIDFRNRDCRRLYGEFCDLICNRCSWTIKKNMYLLDIESPGLDIYYYGEFSDWEYGLKYSEGINCYVLFDFPMKKGMQFKNNIQCYYYQQKEVIAIIEEYMKVKPTEEPLGYRMNIWFVDLRFKTVGEGVFINNIW